MKRVIVFIILCFMFLPQINAGKFDGFIYNGNQGGGGVSGGGSCDIYNGYCLYNSMNNVGLRFTMVYCDQKGNCQEVTSINGKTIKSFDVFRTALYKPANEFYYVGSSKANLKTSVSHGDYSFYIQSEVLLTSLINKGTSPYYSGYDKLVPTSDIQRFLELFSNSNKESLTISELRADALKKGHVSSENCTSNNCYGYRIFVEPLFTFISEKGKKHSILTPTEVAYLTNSGSDMSNGTDYRLYVTAMSLTLEKQDVFKSVPNFGTNATFTASNGKTDSYNNQIRTYLRDLKIGVGLNIIDPMYDLSLVSCETIELKNPMYDLKNMTYKELNRLGNLKIDEEGNTIAASWYRDNCSCEGFYYHYNKKFPAQELYELTKSNILSIFNNGSFIDFNATIYENATNVNWSSPSYMTNYINMGCRYKPSDGGGEDGITCDDVIDYYSKQNPSIDLTKMTKEELYQFSSTGGFKSFNDAYKDILKSEWNADKYINGDCSYKKINCTPTYGTLVEGTLGSCYKGKLEYYDSTNWEDCIFNNNGENDVVDSSLLKYKDDSLSNQYCEVYCTETLVANFDSNSIVVNSGKNFTWNDHYINGSRTCKTKEVKWDNFYQDLDKANQDIIDKYVAWQLEEKLDDVIWTKSSTKDCAWSCDKENPTYPCADGKGTCGGGCAYGSYKDYNYTPSTNNVSFSANGNGYSSKNSVHLNTTCGSIGYKADPNSKKKEYDDSLKKASTIVTTMRNCYTDSVWNEYIYNINPTLEVSYSDGYYNYTGKLDRNIKYGNLTTNLNCKDTKVALITECSGSRCNNNKENMKNCVSVEMSKVGSATFSISDDVFRYVIKDTHTSIHSSELEDLKASYLVQGKTLNYINIGYGNFPVAFSTKNGVYGYHTGQGDLSLTYYDLGHKIGNNTTNVDAFLSNVKGDVKFGEFKCDFTVIDGLIDGNTVVYRTISLSNPFPDIDGSGRYAGNNWCHGDDCSLTNYTIDKFITNNRGVKQEEVYNEEPMYTFTLTPSLIKQIRGYNTDNSYTSFYGSYQGEVFDFVCDNGVKCISEYVTELIEMTGATGTCTTDRLSSFDSCRYTNS